MLSFFLGHALACILLFVSSSLAQTPPPAHVFQWGFGNQFLSNKLPACTSFPITITILNSSNPIKPLPPFYMLSFELGGVPQRQFIGNSSDNLSWQVTHNAGAQLWLDVVDSQGSSGGIGPLTYTVVATQNTACIPPTPSQDFTITANATALKTCEPWGLRVKGGVPPYNITIMETGSAIVTNVTLFQTDDAFTYINRGDPGTTLMAAVSDITGRWGFGTPMFAASGSNDTTCQGLVSQSGNSTELDQQQAALAAQIAADKKKKASILAGVLVPLFLLLFIGAGVGFWFWKRKRLEEQELERGTLPPPPSAGGLLDTPEMTSARATNVLSINSFLDSPSADMARSRTVSSTTSGTAPSTYSSSTNPFSSPHDSDVGTSTVGDRTSTSTNGFNRFPARSIRGSAKSMEAGYSLDGESTVAPNRMIVRNPSAGPSSARLGEPTSPPVGEVVYQHQDGGAIVRELPPPYMDRGNSGPPTPQSPQSPTEESAEQPSEQPAATN